MLGIVRAHAPWRVRAAGASGHALARIVHRVIGLLHRVVRLRLDHCHHVSAYGGDNNVGGGWHAQRVDDACASRAAEVASVFAKRIRARCASGEPADGQPVPSDSSTAAKLFDVSACCHVRSCAWLARRARVVCACRACSARACSCARRSAASAGVAVARRSPVRDMPLCALFFALAQKLFCARANTRSVHIPHAASKPHRQPTSLRSWLVLLGPEAA